MYFIDPLIQNYVVVRKDDIRPKFADLLQVYRCDPRSCERISHFFDQILSPCLSSFERLFVTTVLADYSDILGSWDIDYIKEFSHQETIGHIVRSHEKEFREFFRAILGVKFFQIDPKNKVINVTLIVPNVGGGHISIAQAIEEHLKATGGYRVRVIYEDTAISECDPFLHTKKMYNGEVLTYSDIYNKMILQDGKVIEAKQLYKERSSLSPYVPDRRIELLRKAVPIDTDIILVPAAHQQSYIMQLAYSLHIPVSIICSDYSIEETFIGTAQRTHSAFTRICVPASDAEIFKEAKIDLADWEQISVIGYPIRSSFVRESDPTELAKLRLNLGIREDETALLLSMGSYSPTTVLLSLIKQINTGSDYPFPLHVIVVCGKNQTSFDQVSSYLSQNSGKNPTVRFQVHGYVEDIAKFYKVSPLMIGKPGATSVSEAVFMGVYFLAWNMHGWEKTGIDYLVRHNAGEEINLKEPLRNQIIQAVEKKKEPNVFIPDWKDLLVKHIRTSIDGYKAKQQKDYE